MNYKDIINAHIGLMEFRKLKLPAKKGWAVYQLSKAIEDRYAYYCIEERKIATQYAMCSDGVPIVTSDGQISFSSPERRVNYIREIGELQAIEVEGIEPISITSKEIGSQMISPETMEQLSSVIQFIFDEED